jgi:hypothetical protein
MLNIKSVSNILFEVALIQYVVDLSIPLDIAGFVWSMISILYDCLKMFH